MRKGGRYIRKKGGEPERVQYTRPAASKERKQASPKPDNKNGLKVVSTADKQAVKPSHTKPEATADKPGDKSGDKS